MESNVDDERGHAMEGERGHAMEGPDLPPRHKKLSKKTSSGGERRCTIIEVDGDKPNSFPGLRYSSPVPSRGFGTRSLGTRPSDDIVYANSPTN